MVVRREGQELDEVVGQRDLFEEVGCGRMLGAQLVDLRADAIGIKSAFLDPLPDLRARDLGGGRVLHEVVDRGRPNPVQP